MSDQPPVHRDGDNYESWRASVLQWRRHTPVHLKRQALAVRAKLSGKLREVALQLDAGDLNQDNGMEFLLDKLDALFRKEKRRKWDVANDRNNLQDGGACHRSAAERARLRAAELSAKLAAEGKYQQQPMSILPPLVSNPADRFNKMSKHMKPVQLPEVRKLDGGYIAEFEINDIKAREFLTKASTHDLISQQSGAMVFLQGCYLPPQQRLFWKGEKPLTIIIQGDVAAKVQVALHKISQVIRNFEKHDGCDYNFNNFGLTADGSQNTNHFVQDKMFVGLDNIQAHMFDVKKALTGENAENFNFIIQQTGAKIFLRGRTSGYIEANSGRESFEALHIYISHPRQDGLESARQFCGNLIDTVRKKYEESVRVPPIQQPLTTYQPSVYPHIAVERSRGGASTEDYQDRRYRSDNDVRQSSRHSVAAEDYDNPRSRGAGYDNPRSRGRDEESLYGRNGKTSSTSRKEEERPRESPQPEKNPKFSEEPKKKKRKFSEDPKLLEKALSEQLPPPKLQFRSEREKNDERKEIFKAPVAPVKSIRPSKVVRIGALSSLIAYDDDDDSD